MVPVEQAPSVTATVDCPSRHLARHSDMSGVGAIAEVAGTLDMARVTLLGHPMSRAETRGGEISAQLRRKPQRGEAAHRERRRTMYVEYSSSCIL